MRSIRMITLLSLVAQTNAKELPYHTVDGQDTVLGWALKALRRQSAVLDNTMLGKGQPTPSCCSCRGYNQSAVARRLHDDRRRGYDHSKRLSYLHTGDRTHPAALTQRIKEAATIEVLLCMHHAHESHLNDIHLSACWSSLGQLATQGPAERCWLQRNAEVLQPLVQHTVRAAETGEIGARQLANVAYGMARSRRGGLLGVPFRVLFAALAKAAERKVSELNPQDLANTAWAFVMMGWSEMPLFSVIAAKARQILFDSLGKGFI